MEAPPTPQSPLQIVLIAGWSGAGKDTLGAYLCANHGFRRFAFADPVKDAAARHYRFDRALADTQEGKGTVVAVPGFLGGRRTRVRELLIEYGEQRRVIDGPGIWARVLGKMIAKAVAAAEGQRQIVITDWRHPEELVELQRFEFAEPAQFYPVRVVRAGQRVSPVASMTEYSLLGFPMPTVDAMAEDRTPLLSYLELGATTGKASPAAAGGRTLAFNPAA